MKNLTLPQSLGCTGCRTYLRRPLRATDGHNSRRHQRHRSCVHRGLNHCELKLYYATGNLGIGKVPAAALDVSGTSFFGGQVVVEKGGTANSSSGAYSHSLLFQTSAYNSSSKVAVSPYIEFLAEPSGNNTAAPASSLHFLYGTGTGAATESGLYFNGNGTIHFASAQTFPIDAGPTGPQGPTGPAGPKGATGATGPIGPAGTTLKLPYSSSSSTANGPAFKVTNTGATTTSGYANAIEGYGGNSGATNDESGGRGVAGYGGPAASISSADFYNTGGIGVLGTGGAGNPVSTYSTEGGYGGVFYGGDASVSGNGVGGTGVYAGGGAPAGIGLIATGSGSYSGTYAGLFYGNVDITGNVYKAGGSFKIDDPIDPENKYLSHSFVESPDMMNIYNGNVVTDVRGDAIVTMPVYFEALNRDFRYQLTTIGSFSRAMVLSEISNGKFAIRTEEGNVKVSWQVTGVRQDAWANAHRIPNEVEKDQKDKGHYLSPELFGHPEDLSIGQRRLPARPNPQQ